MNFLISLGDGMDPRSTAQIKKSKEKKAQRIKDHPEQVMGFSICCSSASRLAVDADADAE